MGDPEDRRLETLEADLKRKTAEIGILTRVAVEIGGTLDLEPLLATILRSMDELFGFQHSMVLLCDASRDVLVVAASRGYADSGVGAEVPIGKGVIGVVAKRKKLMRLGGVTTQRGYVEAAAPPQTGPRDGAIALPGLPNAASMVAIPLLKREDLIGVFYVESAERALFDDRDQALLEAIASQAAIAIQNARLRQAEKERIDELQRANDSLTEWNESSSRFIPYEFLAILGRDRLPEVRRGNHAELTMSTFFSDVRDYTTLVEGQGPAESFAFINEYLSYMESPIKAHELHRQLPGRRNHGLVRGQRRRRRAGGDRQHPRARRAQPGAHRPGRARRPHRYRDRHGQADAGHHRRPDAAFRRRHRRFGQHRLAHREPDEALRRCRADQREHAQRLRRPRSLSDAIDRSRSAARQGQSDHPLRSAGRPSRWGADRQARGTRSVRGGLPALSGRSAGRGARTLRGLGGGCAAGPGLAIAR
jgi:putative methionine-R-sulfoxide reductase with GAF domain